MLNYNDIRSRFIQQGYIIIPKLFDLENINCLKSICARALDRRRKEYLKTHSTFPKKNCSLPEQIEYFSDRTEVIDLLLNTITDQQILSILNCICDRQLFFHGLVYFFNPEERSWRGDWHRDGQINAPDDRTEKSRIFSSSFIRVHLALIADDHLEIVAGSHARWDTPQELEIRKGLNGKFSDSNLMSSTTRINLQPGDAVFFEGSTIHRGNYFAERSRKTLAILYSSPVDWDTPLRTCFSKPKFLKNLPPEKQAIFRNGDRPN
jgi:ectoine hydroxylase-related dioxygenase (phytanoyl-CoA dioxygenase family)